MSSSNTLARAEKPKNRETRRAEASNKSNPKLKRRYGPARGTHHIDKRADQVLAADAGATATADDDLLKTAELARWLGVSIQWLETCRSRGNGPPYQRLSEKCIRYRRGDVRAWLKTRAIALVAKQAEVA